MAQETAVYVGFERATIKHTWDDFIFPQMFMDMLKKNVLSRKLIVSTNVTLERVSLLGLQRRMISREMFLKTIPCLGRTGTLCSCMDRDAAYRETDGHVSSASVSQILLKNACCILCISTSNLKKEKQTSKYLENAMSRNLK